MHFSGCLMFTSQDVWNSEWQSCSRSNPFPSVYLYSALVQLLSTLIVNEDITLVLCYNWTFYIHLSGHSPETHLLSGHCTFCSMVTLKLVLFVKLVYRLWDTRSMKEVKTIDLPQSVTSMVLSKDGNVLIATYGKTISFWDPERWG